jgi:nicotinamidase/pyrazinamidase
MKVLVVVDMQNDFMPGGPLGVATANALVPIINQLMTRFPLVVASQDWHPSDHCSFAINHTGKKTGDVVAIEGISQILWPAHCIQNTFGAELVADLNQELITSIFHKGTDKNIDSYSAFFDNAKRKKTSLDDYLRACAATELYFCGVATDYCVLYSILDAIDLGYKSHIVLDACRGINLKPTDVDNALAAITARGGKIVFSKEI